MASKPVILIYGNCQGGALLNLLARNPDISENYSVHFIANFPAPGSTEQSHPNEEMFKNCEFFLHQVATFIPEFPHDQLLPAGCKRIKFPVFWLKLLWPLHFTDPRNQPEGLFPFGRYPYGDKLICDYIKKGLPADEIYQKYQEMDLDKYINLDRFYEMGIDELHQIDEVADIQVADRIEKLFTEQKLFATINHPSDLALYMVIDPLIEMILGHPSAKNKKRPGDEDEHCDIEIPIHPAIIDHYHLKWITKDHVYRYYGSSLTYDDYLRRYIAYGPIEPFMSGQQQIKKPVLTSTESIRKPDREAGAYQGGLGKIKQSYIQLLKKVARRQQ